MAENFTPGDTIVDEMSITNFDGSETQDIQSFFQRLEIRESIFENVMVGNITIMDGAGLHQMLPIAGEETLTVKFKTSTDSKLFSKKFRIYKMTGFQVVGDKTAAYVLHFVSPEMIENEKVRVKQAFKNKSAGAVCQQMFELLASEKSLTIDATSNNLAPVISDMKPLQAINMMSTYSKSSAYAGSFYMFFENRDGFNFKTVESLYAGPTLLTLKSKALATGQKAEVDDFNTYLGYSFGQSFNIMEAVSKGMFSNTVVGIDILSKGYKRNSFSYATDFDKQRHVEAGVKFISHEFNDTNSQQYKFVVSRSLRQKSSYFKSHSDSTYTYSKTMEDLLPNRLSQIQQMQYMQATMDINGNTDIQAGDVIEIQFPTVAYGDKIKVDPDNQPINGRYLVRDVAHVIAVTEDGPGYKQQLTVVKDCLKTAKENQKS